MATPQPQRPPNNQRELVFCHECQDEWYRDESGIICPSCQSDFTEIMENQFNESHPSAPAGTNILQSLFETLGAGRRTTQGPQDHDHDHDHSHDHGEGDHTHHPFPPVPPFAGAVRAHVAGPNGPTIVRLEGPAFTYTSTRTTGPEGPGNEMVMDLVTTMIRNIVGDPSMPPRLSHARTEGVPGGDEPQRAAGPQRTERSERPRMTPYAATFVAGPGGLNPRDANSAQDTSDPRVLDLQTYVHEYLSPDLDEALTPMDRFLGTFFQNQAGARTPGEGDHHNPLDGFLASFFPAGPQGDYVYSQADLDRVMTQLMEQHPGNAAPPAPKEVIETLPRVKVTEQMVIEGTDCAVCREDLLIEEEVCKLPCSHIYHFDCVSKWLEEHDTCPVCRQSVTPAEKQPEQQAAQATEQQQRVAGNPLVSWAFSATRPLAAVLNPSGSTPTATPAPASENPQQPQTAPASPRQEQPQQHPPANNNNNNNSNNNRSPSSGGGFAGLFRRRAGSS